MHIYDDDIERRSPAHKKVLAGLLTWAFERLANASCRDDITEISANPAGIEVELSWDDYCRNCFMGRVRERLRIPWDVFLSDIDIESWVRAERRRISDEKAARLREKAREEERQQARLQEAAERSEFARLKAKFEDGS